MVTTSILKEVVFSDEKPQISVLLDTPSTKEIRIVFADNQVLKEHSTPYPIVVEVVSGALSFDVNGNTFPMEPGDLISLEGGVPHSLISLEKSVVRLSLAKKDSVDRVKKVVNN